MIRKILCSALALLLCAGLASPAFAAGEIVYSSGEVTVTRTKVEGDYKNIDLFSDGLAGVGIVVGESEKYGFIDQTGKLVIPAEYDGYADFGGGFAWVIKDDNAGVIDKTGKLVIPIEYGSIGDFSYGISAAKKGEKWGFIDTAGNTVIPFEYDRAYNISDGYSNVQKDGKWGHIDMSGKIVVPLEYDRTYGFYEGLAPVQKGDKLGYIDTTGKIVIPLEYEVADYFSENLVAVQKDGKFGYIDKTGKTVIPFEFAIAGNFSEGLARASLVDGVFLDYIDKTGKIVLKGENGTWIMWGNDFHDGFANCTFEAYGDGYIAQNGDRIDVGTTIITANSFSDGLATYSDWGSDGKVEWFILEKRNSSQIPPSAEASPAAPAQIAKPTASLVLVNGENLSFDAYNIDGSNFFKLRDLAYVLSGTGKQFEVGYDGATKAITLTGGKAYTTIGGEMEGKGAGDKNPTATTSKITLDGKEINLTAYNIEGNNYFKLRDVGEALNFGVTWDAANKTIGIDTSAGYTPE